MATGTKTCFDDLTKLATDFVTARQGLWDHAAWMDFIANLQTQGFDVSGEMQANLGNLLEAMKRFYTAATATEQVESAVRTAIDDSVVFVKQHQGIWGHSEWEEFVRTVEWNTRGLSEGATAYLGGVLESIKTLYALSPVAIVQQRLAGDRAKTPPASRPAAAAKGKAETKPAAAKGPEEAKEVKKTKAAPKPLPAAPKQRDDLTEITGIGPTLAKKLNEIGISSYAQIAAFSEDDVEHLKRDIIRFPGRIKRDDWIGQARALSEEAKPR